MADLIRPAIKVEMVRWREALLGGAICCVGVWWLATFYDPVRWIGWAFVALGAVATIAGIQRGRFRQGGSGPGIVQVIERRLAYFGPLTGGVLDLEDLVQLSLDPTGTPVHWILLGQGGQHLEIPVNAQGADALFDVFAGLPGIDTAAMLDVLSRTPDARVTVWQRSRMLLH